MNFFGYSLKDSNTVHLNVIELCLLNVSPTSKTI